MNSIRVFPFSIYFPVENEIKKSSIKEDTRKIIENCKAIKKDTRKIIENCKAIKEEMRKIENCKANNIPEKRFLREVTGKRVGDHYARNIYVKVSLKIAVPRILLTLIILY